MKPTIPLFTSCLLMTIGALPALAQDVIADDVRCTQCVDTRDIASQAVTTSRLGDQAVATRQLRNGAVTRSKLRDGAVSGAKLGPDVNAQLAALEARLVQLENQPKLPQVFADGQPVGGLVAFKDRTNNEFGLIVLSPRGFFFQLEPGNNDVPAIVRMTPQDVFFEASGCVGQAYISVTPQQGFIQASDLSGSLLSVVIRTGESNPTVPVRTFYTLPGEIPELRSFAGGSREDAGGCTSLAQGQQTVVPGYLNDPEVTGVPNEPFTPPITIGQ